MQNARRGNTHNVKKEMPSSISSVKATQTELSPERSVMPVSQVFKTIIMDNGPELSSFAQAVNNLCVFITFISKICSSDAQIMTNPPSTSHARKVHTQVLYIT